MDSASTDSEDIAVWNSCVEIIDATRESVERHIGPQADAFDDEMPCYCALATFGTFLSLLVPEETRFRPLLDCIFRVADHAEIERRGLLAILATQRVDYYGTRHFSPDLAREIADRLASLAPPHEPVFRDAVDIAFRKASEFVTPAI
jgi:hypothetical protein